MESVYQLKSAQGTGQDMYRLANGFCDDMLPWATFGPMEIFELLKRLPYRYDPEPVEFLQRPYYTMTGTGSGGDCDDKAICVGAWARLNKIPYRFVAVGAKADEPPHHVFAEILVNGAWVPMDVTYSFNVMGKPLPWRVREVLHEPASDS